jgi:hypothetical protein
MKTHCSHIWFKEWSTDDYTRYYCMKCLKKIRVSKYGKENVICKSIEEIETIGDLLERIKILEEKKE